MSKTALFKAAAQWDATTVKRLLAADPTLSKVRDLKGRTALHVCGAKEWDGGPQSAKASIATARALLAAGADIDAVHEIPDEGEIFPARPLWYAVARGRNPSLVKMLLERGANPDHCLWAAVWADDVTLARMLLRAGSRTELRFDSETPLLYAARLGRVATLKELLAAGGDVDVRDSKGKTPYDYAKKKRLGEDVLALLSGPTSSKRSRNPGERRSTQGT